MTDIFLVIQIILLIIQIITGIKWLFIPIVLLTVAQMMLEER